LAAGLARRVIFGMNFRFDRTSNRAGETMTDPYLRSAVAVLLVVVGSVPSFLWSNSVSIWPRMAGVAAVAAVYVWIVNTRRFESLWAKSRLRHALITGYAVRTALSIAFPIGMAVDFFPGMAAVSVTRLALEQGDPRLLRIFLTTVLQGCFLHMMLGAFILIVYSLLSLRRPPPEEARLHAFEVIMPGAAPATTARGANQT
jgi:hypothetical protein